MSKAPVGFKIFMNAPLNVSYDQQAQELAISGKQLISSGELMNVQCIVAGEEAKQLLLEFRTLLEHLDTDVLAKTKPSDLH